ncbi:MAG: hypothetical protein IH604_17900 [Burkholderiales bacterium]|nr:hypothetical protein [Burkholderiales bacterium]
MKFRTALAATATTILLAGCAGTAIGLRSGSADGVRGGAPEPGTSYSSAAVNASIGANGYFSLLFLGAMAAGAYDGHSGWGVGPAERKPPQLAEDRSIVERDCSLPMPQTGANLRCK